MSTGSFFYHFSFFHEYILLCNNMNLLSLFLTFFNVFSALFVAYSPLENRLIFAHIPVTISFLGYTEYIFSMIMWTINTHG